MAKLKGELEGVVYAKTEAEAIDKAVTEIEKFKRPKCRGCGADIIVGECHKFSCEWGE